jgi:hypothetical protein
MNTPEILPEMPVHELATYALQDPSESIDNGEDFLGFVGYGGGEFDPASGVLTLSYTPSEPEYMEPGFEQMYRKTAARFVEVEKLLDALTKVHPSRDEWRILLAEKLDAHEL